MKAAVHRIPLTQDERAFFNAVLAAAIDKGLKHVSSRLAWGRGATGFER